MLCFKFEFQNLSDLNASLYDSLKLKFHQNWMLFIRVLKLNLADSSFKFSEPKFYQT